MSDGEDDGRMVWDGIAMDVTGRKRPNRPYGRAKSVTGC